jgi:toxin ParE1/3/4
VKPLYFHVLARLELDEATTYYEELQPGLGIEFLQQVEQTTERLQHDPRMGAPYKQSAYRHYVIHRFPYVIYYQEREDAIWIMAVAHGQRRPDYWTRRRIE